MARITDLPETTLQTIFSLLEAEEAIKASKASKTLFNAWQTRPDLVFDYQAFQRVIFGRADEPPSWKNVTLLTSLMDSIFYQKLRARREKSYLDKKHMELVISVARNLKRYHQERIPIQSFKFRSKPCQDWIPYALFKEGIEIAIDNGAKVIDLYCHHIDLPKTVWEAKNLVELSLRCFYLKYQDEIRCHRLKQLRLEDVVINSFMFTNIVSACQLLEDLEMKNCTGMNFDDISVFPSLKHLHLNNADIGNNNFLEDLDNNCPNLKELVLCDSRERATIKISSSSLENLQLSLENHDEIQVQAPKLREFVYNSDRGSIPDQLYISGVLTAEWTCTINILLSQNLDNNCFYKLKKIITNLSRSKLSFNLKYRKFSAVNFDINKVADLDLDGPSSSIQHLSVEGCGNEETLSCMLDGFFWCCRPKTLSLKWGGLRSIHDTDPFLDRVMNTQYQDHGQVISSKFWQQDLKRVKLEVLDHRKQEVFGHCQEVFQSSHMLDWQTSA
ncbi:OLC1v1009984C1 [Oldenlandia corymbosa var. corymbosa]|uniref:OLC1v1009984C1 n=1 Tax=Oldenlandia corymbosa var. corymbosa TaxID=529605 RepID=A0AAV1DT70_OLDCO|nr:OLC1v1009984C1 [Oldenlandia corymbosa var. corymbosa]